jgi:hypothetical protein
MYMKWRCGLIILLSIVLALGTLVSCSPATGETISLASFTENYVAVSIHLEQTAAGDGVLSATFTPPEGYHLYSKDIQVGGVDGLGRPTLLNLTSNSRMKASGGLIESVSAEAPAFEPRELLVYPSGAVTLSLPVELPAGTGWVKDELAITYMACSASLCKPPVVGKVVQVRVPGADMFDQK